MEKTKQPILPEIPHGEYKTRIEKAKQLMEKHGIEGIILFHPVNIRYYTGFFKANFTADRAWRRAFILPRDGDPVMLIPHIIHNTFDGTTWVEDIRPWGGPAGLNYPKEFHKFFIDTLRDIKLLDKAVGMELDTDGGTFSNADLSWVEFEAIRSDVPNIVDAASMLFEQRLIKTTYEQNAYRKLYEMYVRAFMNATPMLKEGMSQREWHILVNRAFLDEGIYDEHFGSHFYTSCLRLNSFKGRRMGIMRAVELPLMRGDMIMTDGGPVHKGYMSDIQRNICIGNAPERLKRAYRRVLEAYLVAIDAVGPGVKACDVYNKCIKVLKQEPNIKFIGHGIGLEYCHEPPYIIPENEMELRPGMILNIEVGLNTEWGSMMPEDTMIVTETGRDVITETLSQELWIV